MRFCVKITDMKILLAGGGSGGPVAPLLAVAETIKQRHQTAKFLLVGTFSGPESLMAKRAGVEFTAIPAGKWRRYLSLANLFTPFLVVGGFLKALKILKRFRPDCVFGTGSFVQVPVVWAAAWLKIPVVLHQQDLRPSLANTLCQAAADKITVTFEQSLVDFSSGLGLFYKKRKADKIVWTGNPFRSQLKGADRQKAFSNFNLAPDFPTLLVLGGGTGAMFFNRLLKKALPELSRSVQIIHAAGKGKLLSAPQKHYHPYEFIADMDLAYEAADIVLARAGMSTITELSNLKKVAIIVPMPKTHQEENAFALMSGQAAIVVPQPMLTPTTLTRVIRKLLFDLKTQDILKHNIGKIMPHNSAHKIAEIIETLAIKS